MLLFSLIGIGGSYGVAWYGIRINTLANSRTAFASLRGHAFPVCDIPLRSGMSVGMMLISVELLFMLAILLFIPGEYAGVCFLGFAIGESLGAAIEHEPAMVSCGSWSCKNALSEGGLRLSTLQSPSTSSVSASWLIIDGMRLPSPLKRAFGALRA